MKNEFEEGYVGQHIYVVGEQTFEKMIKDFDSTRTAWSKHLASRVVLDNDIDKLKNNGLYNVCMNNIKLIDTLWEFWSCDKNFELCINDQLDDNDLRREDLRKMSFVCDKYNEFKHKNLFEEGYNFLLDVFAKLGFNNMEEINKLVKSATGEELIDIVDEKNAKRIRE